MLVHDIKNNIIDLDTIRKPAIIVFFQSPSCHQCAENLNKAIKIIDSTINIIALVKCPEDIIYRKEMEVFINEFFSPNVFYFDLKPEAGIDQDKSNPNSLFRKYKVNYAPEVLYLSKNKKVFLSYKELFAKTNNVSQLVKVLIKRIG